jgi:hypothetical protein
MVVTQPRIQVPLIVEGLADAPRKPPPFGVVAVRRPGIGLVHLGFRRGPRQRCPLERLSVGFTTEVLLSRFAGRIDVADAPTLAAPVAL